MDSLSSVSPSFVLPTGKLHRRRISVTEEMRREEEEEEEEESYDEVERALRMDGTIPGTPNEFVEQVSSRAYDMRRHLQQSFDSSSYDGLSEAYNGVGILPRQSDGKTQQVGVDCGETFSPVVKPATIRTVPMLEANPWRETPKPVYVLTQRENQLCTMKTRRNRGEVERELGMLFSKGKWQNHAKQSEAGTKFQMLVEDIREGVLVFEDENEAAQYCDLLQGGDQGCEGVAEIEASSVFDLCRKMRALAVLFRRGRTPPLPESLKLNLRARKRSLEDQENLM
ncbi:hypothetical protein RND71_002940 [Anisodus tanguticus]|uniref:Uncharacterized protein n=1 Tax=Anisodus tanguticus TaxID=243964 RepID=A0AAE1VWC2_9SOLA|nr:hypothetical protein RND71_002940 [Anisodus tanguticus]